MAVELHDLDELRRYVAEHRSLDGVVVQDIDLTGEGELIASVSCLGATFLGVDLAPATLHHVIDTGGVVFPDLPGLPFDRAAAIGDVPGVVDEELVTTEIDGTAYAAAKAAAMRAHATQITVDGPWFVLSNELAQPLFTTEYYELVGAPRPAARERDLFEGTGTAEGGDL